MEVILADQSLSISAGAQTYLVTLARFLEQLGHGVVLCTLDPGPFSERLEAEGFRVCRPDGLPEGGDAIVSQDAPIAWALAEQRPGVPQLFVMHSAEHEVGLPPQVPGGVGAVAVLNERVRARAEAMALDVPIVRLRQPVDYMQFRPRSVPRAGGPRAIILSHRLRGQRRDLITGALEDAGIPWEQVGAAATPTLTPEDRLRDADIVIGYGRALIEGMAAGCAAYVCELGLDGWITPDTYAAIEADGFAGFATGGVATRERLAADFAAYDPQLGIAARELAVTHHSPSVHADAVGAALKGLAPASAPVTPAGELARLVRRNWDLERTATQRTFHLYDRIDALRGELDRLAAELGAVWDRTHAAEARLEAVTRSRAYRLARALGERGAAVRARRRPRA